MLDNIIAVPLAILIFLIALFNLPMECYEKAKLVASGKLDV